MTTATLDLQNSTLVRDIPLRNFRGDPQSLRGRPIESQDPGHDRASLRHRIGRIVAVNSTGPRITVTVGFNPATEEGNAAIWESDHTDRPAFCIRAAGHVLIADASGDSLREDLHDDCGFDNQLTGAAAWNGNPQEVTLRRLRHRSPPPAQLPEVSPAIAQTGNTIAAQIAAWRR
jgi:hypothetical protein